MIDYIDLFDKELDYEFHNEYGFKYGDSLEATKSYLISFGVMESGNKKKIDVLNDWAFSSFAELSELHYEYSIYALLEKKDEGLFEVHLSKANTYAYINIICGSQLCGCYTKGNPFLIINKAVFMMSSLLLSNDLEKYNMIGRVLISSLNKKSCIIRTGHPQATISWFVLKLYSLFSGEDITLNKLLQPKDIYDYVPILEDWDTENEVRVIQYIDKMCEIHISQAYDNYSESLVDKEVYNLKYRELFWICQYTFPYEILTWLKLRELKGLSNPREFSHPLMNTLIAKKFLSLKLPLEVPKDLDCAKELLVKIKERCPAIDIPIWL